MLGQGANAEETHLAGHAEEQAFTHAILRLDHGRRFGSFAVLSPLWLGCLIKTRTALLTVACLRLWIGAGLHLFDDYYFKND